MAWFAVPVVAWLSILAARGATQVLFEGFEGAFPGTWSVGDANAAGTQAFWDDVNATFGGEATHSGSWKGYCAGLGYAGTADNPQYQASMQAFMQRSVDLSAYAGAKLVFWQKVPSMEAGYDYCRVLVDGAVVFSNSAVVSTWTQVALDFNAFAGGVHTLRFEFVSDGSVQGEGWYLDDIELTGFVPPGNDNFASAQTLAGASGNVTGTTTAATKEPGEPSHAGNTGGASVWYQWTAGQSGTVTFNTFGSGFDTLLAVYTGSSVGALSVVASNDDYAPPSMLQSSVTFQATAGTAYRIAVDGYGGASGDLQLHWQFVTVTETILASIITNYSGVVIASDVNNPSPGYDRDALRVRSEVRSVNSSPVDHFTSYALQYRLLGPGDVPHPIYDSTGALNPNYTCNYTNVLAIASGGTVTRTNFGAIVPAARLDPYTPYRLELKIYRYGSYAGQALTGDNKSYYHFTNLVSGDLAVNVIAQASLTAWNRIYAVKTVPGKTAFLADASYALLRYDDFSTLVGAAPITVVLNYQLIRSSDSTIVPLKQSQSTFLDTMPSYSFPASGPIAPAVQFFTHTLAVEPADGVQLDAVNALYRLEVRIAHVEQAGQPAVVGNTQSSSDQRLLHFSGHLFFGGIDTVFSSLGNDPPITGTTASFVRSVLAVNNNSGAVVGSPKHVYGDGTPLSVALWPDGHAELTSGNVVLSLNPPGADVGQAAGVNYLRGAITLSPSGGVADFLVQLPAGFGYTTDITQRYLESTGGFPGASLNQSLLPAANPSFAAPLWVCEETKPIWIEVNSTTWDVANGRFVMLPTGATEYVRRHELEELEAAPVPAAAQVKRSNEQYFRSVFRVISPQVIAAAGPDGSARLTAEFTFAAGQFRAHFPYDALISWSTGGSMSVSNDLVNVAASHLTGVDPIELAYNRDCLELNCGLPAAGPATNRFDVGGSLSFTLDGGLAAQGSLVTPAPLSWGYIKSSGRYAHQTQPVQTGGFAMAGIFLNGQEPAKTDNDRPGTILETGVNPSNPAQLERPQDTLLYILGPGDYAGLNFRVNQHPGLQAESTLGAKPSGLYALTSRSKYYVRWGGVNGIHEAVPGSFANHLTIYDYDVNFSNFALSFWDSQNHESRTQGYIDLPYPADITNNFEELKFSCVGDLKDAKVPPAETTLYKRLSYWNADFITQGIKFDRKEGSECAAGQGWLVLAVKAHATHVEEPLYGELGFWANGNILSRYDNKLDDFDSRLKLPNTFTLKGPAQEKYSVTPVADAYFNTYNISGAPPTEGFMNIIGKMDVPFFEDLKVHIHTRGRTNDVSTSSLAITLSGGWPDQGFRSTGGASFFTDKNFDAPNAGFPSAQAGFGFAAPLNNAFYENNTNSAQYHPRAQRTWVDVVHFDYPLSWSSSSRSFQSFTQVITNILILQAENRVKYLSADNAELVFGAQYDGLPTFDIANLAFDAVEQKTGAIQAFVDAGKGGARQIITDALGGMDEMLDTDLHKFFKVPLDQKIQPAVSNLYDDLKAKYQQNPANWQADVTTLVNSYFTDLTQKHFFSLFREIMGTPGADQLVLSQLDSDLAKLSNAVGEVRSIITDTKLAATLAKALISNLAAKYGGSVADDKLLETLNKSKATVTEIDFTLGELQKAIADLRSRITDPAKQDLRNELEHLAHFSDSEIQAFLAEAQGQVQKYLVSLNQPFGNPFTVYSRSQVEGFIRQRIEDQFFGSPLAASIQTVLKQRFYALDGSVRQGIDSSFQLLNTAIRDVINEGLAALDNSIRSLLGNVDKILGAGRISGYAHIKGDSLNELRLDAYAQLKFTSEMEFNAHFLLKELKSTGEGGLCPGTPENATEVTLEADGSLAHWISSGVNATVHGKFVFAGGLPINMSGGLELNGLQTFEAMTVSSLKASVGFGASENYFSGATTLEMGGFSGSGGVFFGRVCSLDPIKMWDDEVPEVLGTSSPTFTGIYWYQEAWIPVSEILFGIPSSCFFRFDAGTGTGFYVFAEGPTFGGRMHMGASGEALCVFSIKGTVNLTGGKNPNGIKMQGKGKLTGKIGKCPFCKKFSKTVKVVYENGDWDASY